MTIWKVHARLSDGVIAAWHVQAKSWEEDLAEVKTALVLVKR